MKYKISEIGKVVGGGTPSTKHAEYYSKNGIAWITPKDMSDYHKKYIGHGAKDISEEGLKNSSAKLLPVDSILVSSRAPIGYVAMAGTDLATSQGFKSIVPNTSKVMPEYLYYLMLKSKEKLEQIASGTIFKEISGKGMSNFTVDIPELKKQKEIVQKLNPIFKKIEENDQINDNLLELNDKVFSKIFCDEKKFIEAQKIANIKIGKTPPRKEKNWFSSKGITWISISDMKTNVPFINSSKEQISLKAIKKFNITKVKPKTIILSFKLTIGRVKIASSTLTTNEAIVEFDDAQLPYQFLYSYLKKFNFEALGNTSSIAKALNSKIIKKMPIMLPSRKSLNKYILFSTPIFHFLEEKQIENSILNNIKRELLQQYF